jgi:hypothetical protein
MTPTPPEEIATQELHGSRWINGDMLLGAQRAYRAVAKELRAFERWLETMTQRQNDAPLMKATLAEYRERFKEQLEGKEAER